MALLLPTSIHNTTMNKKEHRRRLADVEKHSPKAPLKNEKRSLPGQQIGLYGAPDAKNVRRMVSMLNNPGESTQDDRG